MDYDYTAYMDYMELDVPCPLSPERPLNLITHSLTGGLMAWANQRWLCEMIIGMPGFILYRINKEYIKV